MPEEYVKIVRRIIEVVWAVFLSNNFLINKYSASEREWVQATGKEKKISQ